MTTLETTLLKACALRLQLPAERIPEIRFLIDPFASPMIIGIRHPVLLLPESVRQSMSGFNDHTLAAILSHELAHVRRRDYLSNLAARIIALPISYHPATHTLHRRIRQTREMICDSDASGAFNSSAMYARSLIALAERMIPQANVEAVGLFDHARNTLEERIMKLTEPRLPISLTMRTARIAAGTIVLIAGTCAAATLHLKPSTPLEHAVQVAQAAPTPAPIPDPAASPAPQASSSPKPRPQAHSSAPRIVINGQQRELTPEERKRLDEQLDSAQKKIDSAMSQFNNGEFQKKLADSLKTINSPEFAKQMEEMQKTASSFETPEFRAKIAEAQRSAQALNTPEFRQQMEDMKRQIDSPEFRLKMENAKRLALQSTADSTRQREDARQQLAQATQAIAEARKQVHDADVQRHLDDAQRHIDDVTKKF